MLGCLAEAAFQAGRDAWPGPPSVCNVVQKTNIGNEHEGGTKLSLALTGL